MLSSRGFFKRPIPHKSLYQGSYSIFLILSPSHPSPAWSTVVLQWGNKTVTTTAEGRQERTAKLQVSTQNILLPSKTNVFVTLKIITTKITVRH